MKRIILTFLLAVLGTVCIGQSFLGKTLNETKKELSAKDIYFEEFVNSAGTYTIKYETDREIRMYAFDFSDVCYFYSIEFSEIELIHHYGRTFIQLGFTTVGTQRLEQQFFKMRKGKVYALCTYDEETERYRIMISDKLL